MASRRTNGSRSKSRPGVTDSSLINTATGRNYLFELITDEACVDGANLASLSRFINDDITGGNVTSRRKRAVLCSPCQTLILQSLVSAKIQRLLYFPVRLHDSSLRWH